MHALLTGVVSAVQVQVCTLDRRSEHQRTQRTHLLTRSKATGCAYVLMYVQFVHLASGNEDERC